MSKIFSLKSGIGLKDFIYDYTENVMIDLDFFPQEAGGEIGISEKPARADHYHKKLMHGIGLSPFYYDGSFITDINLNFDSNGISEQPSRSDHKHKKITGNLSFKYFEFDGSKDVLIELQMADVDAYSGTSLNPARADHIHRELTNGLGILPFSYNTAENRMVSVNFEGSGNYFGNKNSVARSDHKHDNYLNIIDAENDFITSSEFLNNEIVFYNKSNAEITKFVIDYSKTADKLSTARNIKLAGDVTGNIDFDGSKNVIINTTVVSGSGSSGTEASIDLINNTLLNLNNEYITFSILNDVINLNNILKADKLSTARNIKLAGDVTGNIDFDGSKNVIINTTVTATPELNAILATSIKNELVYLDSNFIYNTLTKKIELKTDNLINTDNFYLKTGDLLPNQTDFFKLGDVDNRFLKANIKEITAVNIYTDEVTAGNFTGNLTGTADNSILFNNKTISYFAISGHDHLDETIKASAYISPTKITITSNTITLNDKFIVTDKCNVIGDINISGNLDVKGSITSISTENLLIKDNIIELNTTNIYSNILESGIQINRGESKNPASLLYVENAENFYIKLNNENSLICKMPSNLENYINGSVLSYNPSLKSIMPNSNFRIYEDITIIDDDVNTNIIEFNDICILTGIDGLYILKDNILERLATLNDIENSSGTADVYTKTEIDNFFENEYLGKKKVNWNNITNKPAEYTPAAHTHDYEYVSNKRFFNNGTPRDNEYFDFIKVNDINFKDGFKINNGGVNNRFFIGWQSQSNASDIRQQLLWCINPQSSHPLDTYFSIKLDDYSSSGVYTSDISETLEGIILSNNFSDSYNDITKGVSIDISSTKNSYQSVIFDFLTADFNGVRRDKIIFTYDENDLGIYINNKKVLVEGDSISASRFFDNESEYKNEYFSIVKTNKIDMKTANFLSDEHTLKFGLVSEYNMESRFSSSIEMQNDFIMLFPTDNWYCHVFRDNKFILGTDQTQSESSAILSGYRDLATGYCEVFIRDSRVITENDIKDASETVKGIVQFATLAEVLDSIY